MSLAVLGDSEPAPTWLVLAVGEAIRWAIYGVLLGLIYPIFRARRTRAKLK
jgi:hypothetical protein